MYFYQTLCLPSGQLVLFTGNQSVTESVWWSISNNLIIRDTLMIRHQQPSIHARPWPIFQPRGCLGSASKYSHVCYQIFDENWVIQCVQNDPDENYDNGVLPPVLIRPPKKSFGVSLSNVAIFCIKSKISENFIIAVSHLNTSFLPPVRAQPLKGVGLQKESCLVSNWKSLWELQLYMI